MKIFRLTILVATLTGGLAGAANAYNYSACANNNSKTCSDARATFAKHHHGQNPEQWNNEWYQGERGRWSKKGNDWHWRKA